MTKGGERNYETTLNNLLAGVVVHDKNTKILFCNGSAEDILGLSYNQMIGKEAMDPTWKFVHEDQSTMKLKDYPVNIVLSTSRNLNNYVLGIIRPDRDFTTWVVVNGTPVFSAKNKIDQAIINFVDITEFKNTENKLQEKVDELNATNQQLTANEQQLKALNQQLAANSQQLSAMFKELKSKDEKFRLMYENAPIAYQSLDKKGYLLDVNDVWLDWLGYEREEVIGTWFGDYLHPEIVDAFKEIFPINIQSTETITDVEFRLMNKNGSELIADYTANIGRDEKGNFIRTHCVFQDISEKSRMKEKIRENEKRMHNILENSTNLFYTHTTENEITYISPQVMDILGCSQEEAMTNWTNFATDNPINEIGYNNTLKAIETGLVQPPYELELKKTDGSKIFVEVREAPILENGKVVSIAGSLTDITARKEAEKKLEDQNAFLDTIINSSPIAMWVAKLDGTIIRTNDSLCKMLNLNADEIVNKYNVFKDNNLVEQNVMQQVIDVFKKGLSTKFTIHWSASITGDIEFSTSKELWIEVSMFPIYDSNGKMSNVVCQWVDITTRKNAEFELEERTRFLDKIIDSSALSTWISDENGFVIKTNPACLEFFGAKEEEVIGKYSLFKDSVIEKQGLMSVVEDVFNKGVVGNLIIDYNFGAVDHVDIENPTHKIINSILTPVTDSNGKVTNAIVQTIDLSEIKNAEVKLRAAKEKAEESDRLKSAFLANMSHEIRTPMNGILGFADLLKEPGLTGEKQRKYIEIIQMGGERMLSTINDIIEISKIETGQIEVKKSDVNVNELVRHHFDFFAPEAKKKNITFNCQIPLPDDDSYISVDKNMLNSIITNLIKNAIKYTNSGSIDFGYALVDNEIKFYFKDTGIGISEEDQKTVFERFIQSESTKNEVYEGSGLGLSITKAYVDMLDGRIWLESKVKKGSVFYFTLPYQKLRKGVNGLPQFQPKEENTMLKDLKVLITEDDIAADQLLTEILDPLVKKIYHAKSGNKALEIHKKETIDLILMDIKIQGKDGLSVTREIRESDNDVLIIAQTAYAMAGDREKALEAGCNAYLTKPISKSALLTAIKSLI